MWHQLAHRVGRSSQATPAAVDKFLSASNTKIQTPPLSGLFFSNPTRRRVVLGRVAEPIDSIKSSGVEPVLRASIDIDIVILVILQCQAPR